MNAKIQSVGSLGPARQIYDRNYYLNLMKQKNSEIADELKNEARGQRYQPR